MQATVTKGKAFNLEALTKSAESGDANAMFKLGQHYQGTNLALAESWYEKAKAIGHEASRQALIDLARRRACH